MSHPTTNHPRISRDGLVYFGDERGTLAQAFDVLSWTSAPVGAVPCPVDTGLLHGPVELCEHRPDLF
jgi:hypothetical protein